MAVSCELIVRKVFFWLLITSFCVITPLIVGYALGYRYNFSRGIFIYAGSITLKTNPEEVSIEINGISDSSQKTNYLNGAYTIDGLKPGEYTIRVFRDGFQDWKKTVTVQSGVSTEFWNVLLPRNEYSFSLYANTEGAVRFFPSPKKNFFAVARNVSNQPFSLGITLVNTANSDVKEIYKTNNAQITSNTLENIEWSPREDRLLVPLEMPTKNSPNEIQKEYLVLPVSSSEEQPKFFGEIIPAGWKIENARWSPEEEGVVYFLHENSLWKVSLQTPQSPALVAQNILGYDFYTNNIIALHSDNHILYRHGLAAQSEPEQITRIPLSEDDGPHRIIAYDDRKAVFLNSRGELFVHNAAKKETFTKKIASSVEGAQFSNDGKKLLFWNSREVSIFFMEEWETQPQRTEGDLIQIARFFDPVHNIQWTRDYEHILFSQGKEMRILDLDMRGEQNGFTLKTLSTETPSIFMSADDERIYYTDKENGEDRFFSIDFPEPETFLGF